MTLCFLTLLNNPEGHWWLYFLLRSVGCESKQCNRISGNTRMTETPHWQPLLLHTSRLCTGNAWWKLNVTSVLFMLIVLGAWINAHQRCWHARCYTFLQSFISHDCLSRGHRKYIFPVSQQEISFSLWMKPKAWTRRVLISLPIN